MALLILSIILFFKIRKMLKLSSAFFFWHYRHTALSLPPTKNHPSDYGSEGLVESEYLIMKGPVAQLNRASDYGSEGFRFES